MSIGLKKKNKQKPKLFESYIIGWVHVLAGSWFIYCMWPGCLLELWRSSECFRKATGENVRHSASIRRMQVHAVLCRYLCSVFLNGSGACSSILVCVRLLLCLCSLYLHMPHWNWALWGIAWARESLFHWAFVNINQEKAGVCTTFLFEAQNPWLFFYVFLRWHNPCAAIFLHMNSTLKKIIIVSKRGIRYHFKIFARSLYLEV